MRLSKIHQPIALASTGCMQNIFSHAWVAVELAYFPLHRALLCVHGHGGLQIDPEQTQHSAATTIQINTRVGQTKIFSM